jgi:hypothetical protein
MQEVTPPVPDPVAEEEALLDRQARELLRLRLVVPVWLRRNPGLTLTALYLFASVVGVFFHFLLLRRFGFNVLEFSETTDFLMVVVREPLTVALALLGVVFYVVYIGAANWVGALVQGRFPRLKWSLEKRRKHLEDIRRIAPWLQVSFIGVYALVFVMVYSKWRANRIKDGDFRPMIVDYKTDSPLADGTFRAKNLALLGTTSRFLFFYDPATKRADVVPLDSIARLNWDARTRREKKADQEAAASTEAAAAASTPAPAAPVEVPAVPPAPGGSPAPAQP